MRLLRTIFLYINKDRDLKKFEEVIQIVAYTLVSFAASVELVHDFLSPYF